MPKESARPFEPKQANNGVVTLEENPRAFSLWQRVQIAVASVVGYLAVLLIGRTLRFEVHGWENWEAARKLGKGLVYTFWHREIFSATWFWRKRGIVVMTSRNFDGEYIARIIRCHGYDAARGSSSKGAGRALVEMLRCHRAGRDSAFTIDGPRGPRFVAKRGSVIRARLGRRHPVLPYRGEEGFRLPQELGPDRVPLPIQQGRCLHRRPHCCSRRSLGHRAGRQAGGSAARARSATRAGRAMVGWEKRSNWKLEIGNWQILSGLSDFVEAGIEFAHLSPSPLQAT